MYAMVGRAGQTDTPAPPAVPANTPAPPDPDGDVEGGLPEPESEVMSHPHPPETAEYACVRKLRKAEKAPQKRDSGTDMGEPPVPPPRHAPPSHPAPPPPHPHSTKLPRRNMDAFSVPAFPKVCRGTFTNSHSASNFTHFILCNSLTVKNQGALTKSFSPALSAASHLHDNWANSIRR